MKLTNLFLLAQAASLIQALSPAEWRNQSIYFVMTDRFARTDGSTTAPCDTDVLQYCGGSWQGIINHLDYIQNMGFTALWITPVTHQIETAPGYHGYWQDDLYDVNEHYGTSTDLKALSSALHDRGMYLMIDVVANHFAAAGISNASEVDYSVYKPFNDKKYFHPPHAIDDYSNQTLVETGWLVVDPDPVALPDVFTTRQDVRDYYYAWIKDLVANYSADGLRVDTVKHVEKDFWTGFDKASGVYCVGEVFIEDQDYLCDYQNYMDGLLNYGVWYSLIDAFWNSTGSMQKLADSVNSLKTKCKDTSLLGSFMENHDNPRFPSFAPDITLAANAISFTILQDGIPIIYQGQEQHYAGGQDPHNREAIWLSGYKTDAPLYKLIQSLNKIRLNAIEADGEKYLKYQNWPIYTDDNTIALRKGYDDLAILGVFSNQGSGGQSYTLTIPGENTGYTPGSSLTEVLSCTQVTVGDDGSVPVAMDKGEPKVFFPTDKLTELCCDN